MASPTGGCPALTSLSEEEEMFRAAVRDFAQGEVAPRARAMEEAGEYDRQLISDLFGLGLMGIEIPEAYGGAGGSFFQAILAVEELSKADAAVGVLVDVQNTLFNNAILRWASEDQKARYLPRMATDTVGAYALSEAGSGSDAFALAARAERRGDSWVLKGRKLWITNGGEAGVFIIFANADPAQGYRGITAFLVERGDNGFTVGKREHKLGIRASSTCELLLDDLVLGAERVLGEVGKGYRIAIETLNEGRIGIGAQMVGVATAALEAAAAYSKERQQFGRPICEFQAVQHQIADCATRLEAARLLVYNAARLRDSGQPFVTQAAMSKLFASEAAEFITSMCLELFGGYGYTVDYAVEKYYRDAKIGKIYEGTSNMQRDTIAKMVLRD